MAGLARATGMVATAKPQLGQGIRILASRKPGWQDRCYGERGVATPRGCVTLIW